MNCRTLEHRHFERTLRSSDTVPGPLLAEGRFNFHDCRVGAPPITRRPPETDVRARRTRSQPCERNARRTRSGRPCAKSGRPPRQESERSRTLAGGPPMKRLRAIALSTSGRARADDRRFKTSNDDNNIIRADRANQRRIGKRCPRARRPGRRVRV